MVQFWQNECRVPYPYGLMVIKIFLHYNIWQVEMSSVLSGINKIPTIKIKSTRSETEKICTIIDLNIWIKLCHWGIISIVYDSHWMMLGYKIIKAFSLYSFNLINRQFFLVWENVLGIEELHYTEWQIIYQCTVRSLIFVGWNFRYI